MRNFYSTLATLPKRAIGGKMETKKRKLEDDGTNTGGEASGKVEVKHVRIIGRVETSGKSELHWTTGGVETLIHKREIAKSDIGQVHEVRSPSAE